MGKVSVSRNGSNQRVLSHYESVVRSLSDRLVEAQRPIRILDGIKWDDEIERAFFAQGARELPPVTRAYYQSRPLPFDPQDKLTELQRVEDDVRATLGVSDAPGQILCRMCREYREVVQLLANRGTRTFGRISTSLYGSASEPLHDGSPRLTELGRNISLALASLQHGPAEEAGAEAFTASQAVVQLAGRLAEYFQDPGAVRVRLSDGIVADAAAGCDYIKVRGDASFTARDLRILEVHEGWVHLGTTLNGQQQPVCTFLSKGPPSSTITQEGLAVLMEVFTASAHPGRIRRVTNRIEAVAQAEAGANFLEVYRWFLDQGYAPRESYQHTVRVFRGSLPEGCGPFTKDLCYSKGLLLVCNFIRLAAHNGLHRCVPLLFCGKTTLGDLKMLAELVEVGLVDPPRYLPPQFSDLEALATWADQMASTGSK